MSNPPLWDLVNTLYHGVMDNAPQPLQDRAELSALILGAGGTYLLVRGLQYTSEHWMDRIIPGFNKNWLPKLEIACVVVMTAVPVGSAVIAPETALGTIREHPVYTVGMAGAYFAGIKGVFHNRSKRPKQKTLEEEVVGDDKGR